MIVLKLKINESNNSILNNYYLSNGYKTYDGDSGLDLIIPENVKCKAGRVTFINHLVSCEMIKKSLFGNKNISYMLVPRSSISKTPLIMANSIGIVDSGYRGNLLAAVYNTGKNDYTIYSGTRLFQVIHPTLCEFKKEMVSKLSTSKRGSNGYGSTTSKKTNKTSTARS